MATRTTTKPALLATSATVPVVPSVPAVPDVAPAEAKASDESASEVPEEHGVSEDEYAEASLALITYKPTSESLSVADEKLKKAFVSLKQSIVEVEQSKLSVFIEGYADAAYYLAQEFKREPTQTELNEHIEGVLGDNNTTEGTGEYAVRLRYLDDLKRYAQKAAFLVLRTETTSFRMAWVYRVPSRMSPLGYLPVHSFTEDGKPNEGRAPFRALIYDAWKLRPLAKVKQDDGNTLEAPRSEFARPPMEARPAGAGLPGREADPGIRNCPIATIPVIELAYDKWILKIPMNDLGEPTAEKAPREPGAGQGGSVLPDGDIILQATVGDKPAVRLHDVDLLVAAYKMACDGARINSLWNLDKASDHSAAQLSRNQVREIMIDFGVTFTGRFNDDGELEDTSDYDDIVARFKSETNKVSEAIAEGPSPHGTIAVWDEVEGKTFNVPMGEDGKPLDTDNYEHDGSHWRVRYTTRQAEEKRKSA